MEINIETEISNIKVPFMNVMGKTLDDDKGLKSI